MNPVEALIAASGNWRGSSTLQDPHTGQPEESSSTVVVTPVLGGRFVRLDYAWGYQGRPQEGSLLVGFDPETGEVSGHWIDTWHMGSKGMGLVGTGDGTIRLVGSYAAPPGPDWGWRIDIAVEPLRITHTNLFPDGREAPAAEGTYARA